MKILLDTHYVARLLPPRLDRRLAWLERYQPWGVSPLAILEIQYLVEIGRSVVRGVRQRLEEDPRFVIDDINVAALAEEAQALSWTRDTFDRLLCAHSLARRVPLCTADERILAHHRLLPRELR